MQEVFESGVDYIFASWIKHKMYLNTAEDSCSDIG